METLKRCRLCLELIRDSHDVVDSTVKDMLNFLVPQIDLELSPDPKICSECSKSLHVACELKSTCLKGKVDTVQPAEPRAVCAEEQNFCCPDFSNASTEETEQKDVKCSLCHSEFGTFSVLEMEERSVLCQMLQERYLHDLDTAKCSATCEKCLGTILNFFNTSLDTEEYTKNYFNIKGPEIPHVDLNDVFAFKLLSGVDTRNSSTENETLINTMVSVENTTIEPTFDPVLSLQPIFEAVMENYQDVVMASAGTDVKNEEYARKVDGMLMYQCSYCPYQTKCRRYFKIHVIKHKDPSEVPIYKCELCSYEAKFKFYVTRHMLIHKDPSEIKMHRCDICHFETKLKGNLTKHMKTHQAKLNSITGVAEWNNYEFDIKQEDVVQRYRHKHRKCDQCDFETGDCMAFKIHVLQHKDPSVQLFSCIMCTYKGKSESLLKKHMLLHKDPSEIKMYKCDKCHYETRHKHHIDSHILIHMDPSEIEMYRCGVCSYETRHKRALKRHTQIHNK